MLIQNACENDKQEVLALYRSMLYGPADWDEHYPGEDTIDFDLKRNALFVMRDDAGKIAAVISIDDDEAVERLDCWDKSIPSRELARLCVREDMQNHGIAKMMMRYAFDRLREQGNKGVHILVRKNHNAALAAYRALGFEAVGDCRLFDKEFVCMEMRI